MCWDRRTAPDMARYVCAGWMWSTHSNAEGWHTGLVYWCGAGCLLPVISFPDKNSSFPLRRVSKVQGMKHAFAPVSYDLARVMSLDSTGLLHWWGFMLELLVFTEVWWGQRRWAPAAAWVRANWWCRGNFLNLVANQRCRLESEWQWECSNHQSTKSLA